MADIVDMKGQALGLPDLSDIMSYRGVHVLGTLRYDEGGRGRLTASYYASCLIYGQAPLWGLWQASGRCAFVRFYGYRHEIERAYPKLVWRRRMASWNLNTVDDLRPAARARVLSDRYQAELPATRKEDAK